MENLFSNVGDTLFGNADGKAEKSFGNTSNQTNQEDSFKNPFKQELRPSDTGLPEQPSTVSNLSLDLDSPMTPPESASRLSYDQKSQFASNDSSVSITPPRTPRAIKLTIAANEDLVCSYVGSNLTSLSVQGSLFISGDYSGMKAELNLKDQLMHITDVVPNAKFLQVASEPSASSSTSRHFLCHFESTSGTGPYVEALRYKGSTALRPAPLRVQAAARHHAGHSKLSLQVTANPGLSTPLIQVKISAKMKNTSNINDVKGRPPVVFDEVSNAFEWTLAGLNPGQKQLLEVVCSALETDAGTIKDTAGPDSKSSVIVSVQCNSQDALLSQIQVTMEAAPGEDYQVLAKVAKRFRVIYKNEM